MRPRRRYAPGKARVHLKLLGLSLFPAYNLVIYSHLISLPRMTQKEHADEGRLPLHARRIDHPHVYLYPSQVPRQAQTRDSCLSPAWGGSRATTGQTCSPCLLLYA
jgi:hypothetical protein